MNFYGMAKNKYPWLYFAAATLAWLTSILTMSRNALIFSTLSYAACVLIFSFVGEKKKIFRIIVLIGLAFAAVFAAVFFDKIYSLFKDFFDRGLSDNGRYALWRSAFKNFLEAPIFNYFFHVSCGLNGLPFFEPLHYRCRNFFCIRSRFYYRISAKKGDITSLGEEHEIKVANNTTYPSPFILSDDPDHIYLCWRGINWHPTIAKLSLPDENDKVAIEWGPYQMVQSTGARPYAKYHSNGKDKIYVAYTTGHPDNEWPNWLYFNTINLNAKTGADGSVTTNPQLADLKGNVLSTIANGVFNVSKTESYKSAYPGTILDAPTNYRDWVWQIAIDDNENPVVAMVRISQDKNSHQYYYIF